MSNLLVRLLVSGGLASLLYLGSIGHAQAASYEFLVPEGSPISADPRIVVQAAESSGQLELTTNCAPIAGSYPVQSLVTLDRLGVFDRLGDVAVILSTAPLPPGTRLGVLTNIGTCSEDGITFLRFQGIVE